MSDRELLELAAKAAGLEIIRHSQEARDKAGYGDVGLYVRGKIGKFIMSSGWNPLTDDGDALRLAASLKIDIEWQSTNPFPEDTVEAYRRNPEVGFFCATYPENDYRRAIVRAAAEIVRNMP